VIGTVHYRRSGEAFEARLGDDGRWATNDPTMGPALELLRSFVDTGPARGFALVQHVRDVAALVGGSAAIEARSPGPAGRVY
jgi:hypothetical protein